MYVLIWVWEFVQVCGLYLLLIAVHEAGHHLAGALVGYRWKGWVVGPLQVSHAEGRLRVRLSKTPLDGLAISISHANDTRARQAISIMGGPLASLLFGIGVFLHLRHLPGDQHDVPWQMTTLMLMSFWLVLASIIPYSYKGFENDGTLLVQLWKDRDEWLRYYADREHRNASFEAEKIQYEVETIRFEALTTLVASMKTGQRPREWDAGLMEQAVALCDGKPNEVAAVHYGFYWAADRGDWERGGHFIGRALALRGMLPGPWRAKVLLDGAYHAGLAQNDAAMARLLLTEASGIVAEDADDQAMLRSMTLRAEAAALLAEGKPEKAMQKAWESLLSLAFVTGKDCSDRCVLEHFIAKCLARTPE